MTAQWKFWLAMLVLATVVFACACNIAANTLDSRARIEQHYDLVTTP